MDQIGASDVNPVGSQWFTSAGWSTDREHAGDCLLAGASV